VNDRIPFIPFAVPRRRVSFFNRPSVSHIDGKVTVRRHFFHGHDATVRKSHYWGFSGVEAIVYRQMVARLSDAGNVHLENERITHFSIGLERILTNTRRSA
jgi:hypothetical protein